MYFWSLMNLFFLNISISYNYEKSLLRYEFDWLNISKSFSGFVGFDYVLNEIIIIIFKE